MLRSTIAALGIAALAGSHLTMPLSAQQTQPPPRLVVITGHGEVKAAPDMAIITVGVMTQSQTAREAVSANNAAMAKVIASLKSAAIADKDIQTSNFSVNPRYEYPDNTQPRLIGYDVVNSVTVAVRNLETLGTVLDKVVSEGSNQINGIMFTLANPDPLTDEARKLAVADARRKAEIYAKAAGIGLGRVMSLSESGGGPPPVPVYGRVAMKAEAASSVPVAQGEQTVTVDVNIAWEIN
jgi:uncharacterized protein YggE